MIANASPRLEKAAKAIAKRGTAKWRETGWMAMRDILRVFDVTRPVFDQTIRPIVPDAAVRVRGRNPEFYARAVIEAWALSRLPLDDDSVMAGKGETPQQVEAMERWRAARADIQEMNRDRLAGLLIPRDEVHRAFGIAAGHIRHSSEACCESCRACVHGGLDDASVEMERQLTGGGDDSEEDAETGGDDDA